MKKFLILLLLASAVFTSCASSDSTEDTVDESESATVETTAETAAETEPETTFQKVTGYFEHVQLELASEPVYQDGKFLLYFTSDTVHFDEETQFVVGIRATGEAYSILGYSETDQHPDMKVGDAYCGIAIRPSKEIPAGSYILSVTFEQYICEFEFTIS